MEIAGAICYDGAAIALSHRPSGFRIRQFSAFITMASKSLEDIFRQPPAAYGPVPFYWWAGEALDRKRVAWQLDQLRSNGVRRVVVSYPHLPDGSCDPGEPPLFSPEWWEFFRWFLGACRDRGMTAGFQDYNLLAPVLAAIARETPGMQGGQLSCVARHAADGQPVRLIAEPNCPAVGVWAYPTHDGVADPSAGIDLSARTAHGMLDWRTPAGKWLVALVFARPAPFDPLHPAAGRLVIERFYHPFERECGTELGTTLNLFFQDELDFGGRMPFWSASLLDSFRSRIGYDLAPVLPALWHDLGPLTEKIRLDYAEVVACCMEERFFEPMFRWHESRGILFGHDNCGRGLIAEGRAHYGDYFRTMRWYSAPGCDDPKLDGPRAFKGLKVNSSIAHLYQRPRVWIEAFHSSGWGSAPAEVIAALHEDFAYGANVVNLHGLYYTTRAGWWEWAPPDFHFRQPYWRHCHPLNCYINRLSWLLSQGRHRCEVAIVYPIAALDAKPAQPGPPELVAHMGNQRVTADDSIGTDAENAAFGIGKFLFDHACDFDFIDAPSLAAAVVEDGSLRADTTRYRVLVFPAMAAVRIAMLERARDFARTGGLVIAIGCLPRASEWAGRDDMYLTEMLEDIFGSADDSRDWRKVHPGGGVAIFSRNGHAMLLETIRQAVGQAVTATGPLQVMRRELDGKDLFFCFNPAEKPVTAHFMLDRGGAVHDWDAWTGDVRPCGDSRGMAVTLAPKEARILVIGCGEIAGQSTIQAPGELHVLTTLDGPWETEIHPVLDNRFGDFRLPAASELIGPDVRRFRYADETSQDPAWVAPDFDDSAWPETTYSFGPQLECLGPLEPDHDLANALRSACWRPYRFSRRWGIERDPFLTGWLSGPHGLKGQVPAEFLDFSADRPGCVWYVRGTVIVSSDGWHTLVTGARCRYQVWLNGESVAHQAAELEPGRYPQWNIPHYQCEPVSNNVMLRQGTNELLVKLVQPVGQRTRAFFAFDPAPPDPAELALRWFTNPQVPRACVLASPDRRAIRFRFLAPPGAREISFVARGAARAWLAGDELALTVSGKLADGSLRYHAMVENPRPDPQVVALRVVAPADCHAGDALPEPVMFVCGKGRLPAGDWCAHGLATYSGIVEYRKHITLAESTPGRVVLDLGQVKASAEVRLNGRKVATLLAPPWRCELTPCLRAGSNELCVMAANTLANHYSVGIPTPYAFPAQTRSGLLGPVRLLTTQPHP